MNTIDQLQRYLAVMEQKERSNPDKKSNSTSLPFITISRQKGAGALLTAKAIIEKLQQEKDADRYHDWQIIDKELCKEMLQHRGVQDSLQSLFSENYHSQINEFVQGLFGTKQSQDTAILQQSRLIRSLASLGKVIIIGRAGSQVTKEIQHGLHLRLIGSEQQRITNILKVTDISEKQACDLMHEKDQERKRLLHDHYHIDIDDPLNYDAIFNVDSLEINDMADAAITILKSR